MRILVVENEQRAREGICHLIESLGNEYHVIAQASNGEVALELIEQLHPDVVFTDIKMPFMDGITLIQKVREKKLSTEFAVISAFADFEMAKQCISLDVTEYIVKPLTQHELQTVMERLQARISGDNVYPDRKDESLRARYPDAHPMVLQALDLIEQRYTEKLNQAEIAAELGISAQYFSYIFARHVGDGFSAFLKTYRIQQAEKLIRAGVKDSQDLAEKVGFSDSKYFQKVFHQETGKTLSEYRRSL